MNRVIHICGVFAAAFCLLIASPSGAPAQSNDPNSPNPQQPPVDAATKQLMAANGLYARGLYKLAADEYGQFLGRYPTHAQATAARYALAVCRYRLTEYGAAVDQLHQVLQDAKFEQRDEALAVLGHCELSQNHYDPALAAFNELIDKYPTSKHAQLASLNRGQALYLAARYAEAAKACESYLTSYPDAPSRPEAIYFLGLAQRALNENDAAAGTLTQLVQRYPDSPHKVDALLVAGQALEAQGKLDGAVEAFRQMLAAAPEARKPDALYSLGIALYKSGKYELAARELSTLVTESPGSPYAKPARLQLGLALLAAGQTTPARDALANVLSQDPERANSARYGLAECDLLDKKYAEARQRLDELMSLQPPPANISQIALDHAVCTMELTRFQEAANELQTFRGQYPNAPQLAEATYRQAFCLHKLQKYQQSHDLCLEAARLKAGGFAAANAELDAEDLFLLGKYSDAQRQFAALAASTKDDGQRLRFAFRQGQCAYFSSDYPRAVELLTPLTSDPKIEQDENLRQAPLLLGDALLQQGKYADAIAPLKQYLQFAQGDRPQAQYKLAMAELHGSDVAQARQAFEAATQGPANSPWVQRAWFERGQLDLKDKKYEEAADAFRQVLSSGASPDIAGPAGYQLGWAEFEAKRFPEAAAAWKQMAAAYPKDKLAADAEFQQAVALREAKQLSPALDAFQGYAAAHPDGQHVYKAKQLAAACLKELGHNDQAGQMLASLAGEARGTGADSILYDLAWAQRDAKDAAAAQATYRRLLSEHADSKLAAAARTELAELLYDEKKFDESAALLEQVVADKSADPKIVGAADYRLGWCYQQLKRPQQAAAVFAAYTQKGGGNDEMLASALVQAGLSYAADGRYDKAEESLAQMIQKFPNQKDAPVAMLKLGEVQAEQNEYDASARTCGEFLQKYPTSEFAYRAQFGVGWALENQKRYEEARQAYQKVIAATNGETAARAQFQIGETWLAEGKFEQAIPALLAVDDVYKYPKWSARALFEAGRAFEQLKQPDRAKKQYADVAARYKDAPEAEMAQTRLRTLAGG